MSHIQICSYVSGWHNVDKEMARKFIENRLKSMVCIPPEDRVAFVEKHCLRGISVKELMEGSQ